MDSWIPRQAQRAVQDVLQDVHEASVHDVPQRATLVRKKKHVAPTTNASRQSKLLHGHCSSGRDVNPLDLPQSSTPSTFIAAVVANDYND